VRVNVFDEDRNLILLTKNVVFRQTVDTKFMKLLETNMINSEFLVQADSHDHGHQAVAHKTMLKAALAEIKTT